jgi:hypothetical protein
MSLRLTKAHENHVEQALPPVHRDQRRQHIARVTLALLPPWSRRHVFNGAVMTLRVAESDEKYKRRLFFEGARAEGEFFT